MRDLVAQRLFALILCHEDVNDHDTLRADRWLALALGHADVTGTDSPVLVGPRPPLAGSSTLNELDLGTPEVAGNDRYKQIAVDAD